MSDTKAVAYREGARAARGIVQKANEQIAEITPIEPVGAK